MKMSYIVRNKIWRDSASLILLAKQQSETGSTTHNSGDYDVLLQTRTDKATFRNTAVFPGGVSEPADGSERWLSLFKLFGYSQQHFNAYNRPGAPTTPIFQENPIRHISLRITAIRETFEELGVLICSCEHSGTKINKWASVITDVDSTYWRKKISNNPENFLNLCKEYKCYPDIWALRYWSNWLTPTNFKKRFDTAFFITALETKPVIEGNSEVTKTEWASPLDILKRSRDKEVKLPPPQAYELSRLAALTDVHSVVDFAQNRRCCGDELQYPVIVHAKDGTIHLQPGDSLYPAKVDYINDVFHLQNKTAAELREISQTLHRLERAGPGAQFILKNFKPTNNHLNMGDRVIPFEF